MPETKQLLLHVGLPKTASSAIQTFAWKNRAGFARQGLDYPEVGTEPVPKHQYVVNEIMSGRLTRTADVILNSSQPRILLSAEGLTNHLYDFPPEALAGFRRLIDGFETKAFIVLRDPYAWARSYYKQAIINPIVKRVEFYATGMVFSRFVEHPRVLKLMDHQAVMADLAQGFGAKVVAADFGKDWLGQFRAFAGLDLEGMSVPAQVNNSPPDWAIEIMRQVNLFGLTEGRRAAWKAALQGCAKSNHTLFQQASAQELSAATTLERDVLDALVPMPEGDLVLSADQLAVFKDYVKETEHGQSTGAGHF